MFRTFFLCILCLPLFAAEEIIVELSQQSQLAPLYLSSIVGSDFPSSYLSQLEKVLQFDFQNNGKTYLTTRSTEKETLSRQETYDPVKWKSLGVSYLIRPSIQDKQFTLTSLNCCNGEVKKLQPLPLSGNLDSDRRIMHQASDAVFYSFFHEEGIASMRILYTVKSGKSAEVWESDYDGANAKKLTQDGELCVTPSYIFPHHYLYVSYKIGQPKIFLASTKGGEAKRVSFLRGNQLMPILSSKKDKIAFINDITGNPDLFIQNFSVETGVIGKPQQVFSAPGATQGSPTFSPDGDSLAFVSNKDGTARIYTLKIPPPGASLKSLSPRLISKKNRANTSPAWSLDGTKIAYSANTAGVRQIWIYDIEKDEEWQLTQGQKHKENPAWAPNSLHLLFNTVEEQKAELWLINLNQKEATRISTGRGEKQFPAWQAIR